MTNVCKVCKILLNSWAYSQDVSLKVVVRSGSFNLISTTTSAAYHNHLLAKFIVQPLSSSAFHSHLLLFIAIESCLNECIRVLMSVWAYVSELRQLSLILNSRLCSIAHNEHTSEPIDV